MKKKIFSFIIILIVTIIVLYLSLKDDYDTIINTILGINKLWLLVAFLCLLGYYFCKSIVMHNFAKEFKKDFRFREAFRLTLETNFFHAITPFASGGQPYEIYSLTKKQIKVVDATNVSIECFIVYQIALVTLGIIAIVCNSIFHIINSSVLSHLLTLGFMVNLMVIVVLFWLTLSKSAPTKVVNFVIAILEKIKIIKNKDEIKEKMDNYLKEFNSGAKTLFRNWKRFLSMILTQFVSLLCLYVIPVALFYGLGINHITPFMTIVIMAYVMLIGSFVPIPGGTGGLEYAFISLFSGLLTGPVLNAIMLVWRFITYYFGMILGAIVLNFKKDVK